VFVNGRREFITLLGTAAAWPLAARARQNDRIKRIGVLVGAATEHDPESEARLAAFRTGLKELGWFEGRNVRTAFTERMVALCRRERFELSITCFAVAICNRYVPRGLS
jgi:hypothetical protein